jgi:hypothetical protein
LQLLLKEKAPMRAPTPGGVYGCAGKGKITPSFQIEMLLGFFLTVKFHDSLATLRGHSLCNTLQTHEGLSEVRGEAHGHHAKFVTF